MPAELIDEPTKDALQPWLGFLMRRFTHQDAATAMLHDTAEDLHIVTGFGPTNAPTAGTLSVMLGVVELQATLASPVTVVISELGAWNSRNVPWARLEAVRDQMLTFLHSLGFDTAVGTLRSHLDFANLARAGKLARFLTRADFLNHREELLELYEDHNLLGSEVGLTVDALYTVADVLGPAEAGHRHILMLSGLEEAYFTELSRLALQRQAAAEETSLGWEATIGGLYFRVLEGLAGYPKISKSIPASSIHLGMSADEMAMRIRDDNPASQGPLLSAMELASGWPDTDIQYARQAFDEHIDTPQRWMAVKEQYLESFRALARQWDSCAP